MSANGTFPGFPLEIIESFLGYLPIEGAYNNFKLKDAKDSLRACSLVSRSFSAPARCRIFSTITINGYWPPPLRVKRSDDQLSERIKGLVELITSDMLDLPRLIRKLDMKFDPQQIGLDNKCHLDKLLRLLISRSSNLNTLCLNADMPWKDISPEIAQSMTEICRSPALVNLDLHNLSSVPIEFITNNHTLRCLSLDDVCFSIPTSPSDEAPALIHLDAYLLRSGRYNFVDDHSTRDISKMKAFEIYFYNSIDAGKFGRLVKAASPSLASFEFTIRSDSLRFQLNSTVDLGCIPYLRKVSVRLDASHRGLSFPVAGDVISFFNDGMPTMIEEIEIIFQTSIGTKILRAKGFFPTPDEGLESLGYAFLNNKHPRLKMTTVGISLQVINWDGSMTTRELRAIEQSLQVQMTSLINNSNAITSNFRVKVVAEFHG